MLTCPYCGTSVQTFRDLFGTLRLVPHVNLGGDEPIDLCMQGSNMIVVSSPPQPPKEKED